MCPVLITSNQTKPHCNFLCILLSSMTLVRCAGKAWVVKTRQQTLQTYQGWTLPPPPPPPHLHLRAQPATSRLQITCKIQQINTRPSRLLSPSTRLGIHTPLSGSLCLMATPWPQRCPLPSLRWRNWPQRFPPQRHSIKTEAGAVWYSWPMRTGLPGSSLDCVGLPAW